MTNGAQFHVSVHDVNQVEVVILNAEEVCWKKLGQIGALIHFGILVDDYQEVEDDPNDVKRDDFVLVHDGVLGGKDLVEDAAYGHLVDLEVWVQSLVVGYHYLEEVDYLQEHHEDLFVSYSLHVADFRVADFFFFSLDIRGW
jgi:hypothetical protein